MATEGGAWLSWLNLEIIRPRQSIIRLYAYHPLELPWIDGGRVRCEWGEAADPVTT